MRSTIHLAWDAGDALGRFRTGVSLHSHTSHSMETLDFIPRFLAAVPPAKAMLSGTKRATSGSTGAI